MKNTKNADISNIYRLDGQVPIMKAIPFGLQHILAHFQFSEKRDNHRSQNQADCKRNQNRYYNLIIHPHTSYHSFVFIS